MPCDLFSNHNALIGSIDHLLHSHGPSSEIFLAIREDLKGDGMADLRPYVWQYYQADMTAEVHHEHEAINSFTSAAVLHDSSLHHILGSHQFAALMHHITGSILHAVHHLDGGIQLVTESVEVHTPKNALICLAHALPGGHANQNHYNKLSVIDVHHDRYANHLANFVHHVLFFWGN